MGSSGWGGCESAQREIARPLATERSLPVRACGCRRSTTSLRAPSAAARLPHRALPALTTSTFFFTALRLAALRSHGVPRAPALHGAAYTQDATDQTAGVQRMVLLISSFMPSLLIGGYACIDQTDDARMNIMDIATRQLRQDALQVLLFASTNVHASELQICVCCWRLQLE